jgi:hypothetical protein
VDDPEALNGDLRGFGDTVRHTPDGRVVADLPAGEQVELVLRLARAGRTIRSLETRRVSLEERFLRAIGREEESHD